jgi:hypothetical protein
VISMIIKFTQDHIQLKNYLNAHCAQNRIKRHLLVQHIFRLTWKHLFAHIAICSSKVDGQCKNM